MRSLADFLLYILLFCIFFTAVGTMAAIWNGTPMPLIMAMVLFIIVFLLWGGAGLALYAVHLIFQGVKTLFRKG